MECACFKQYTTKKKKIYIIKTFFFQKQFYICSPGKILFGFVYTHLKQDCHIYRKSTFEIQNRTRARRASKEKWEIPLHIYTSALYISPVCARRNKLYCLRLFKITAVAKNESEKSKRCILSQKKHFSSRHTHTHTHTEATNPRSQRSSHPSGDYWKKKNYQSPQ